MIRRRTTLCLGLSQLVCWGISFYLIGVFGDRIMAETGWSRTLVHGGFSVALLTMGLVSPLVGRLIDRVGGGYVMAAGSVFCAIGCLTLAMVQTVGTYYAAWICLGLAMRATLYDAAFATLARIGGPRARQPIAQITLLGGLASTCFWPLGHFLANSLGWRWALVVYAAIALSMVLLHLTIPRHRHRADEETAEPHHRTRPVPEGRERSLAAILYAAIVTLINGLNAGLSAHLIGMLTEFGIAIAVAVSIASLWGIGQVSARIGGVMVGNRVSPIDLNLAAIAVLPLCLGIAVTGGAYVAAAACFVFLYGAGNGIASITRGTLPLVLFDTRTYGAFVGKLLAPSFVVAAASPFAFAAVIDHAGARGALFLAIGIASVTLAAALGLKALDRAIRLRTAE